MNGPHLEIRLVLHGGLAGAADPAPGGDVVSVPCGTSLAAALAELGIDAGLVGVASSCGTLLKADTPLERDAVIDLYPIFGGG
jgi:hypothetical protein